MNCDQARENISPFLDGELESSVQQKVRNHLETCPDCSLYFEEFKQIQNRIESTMDSDRDVSGNFTEELKSMARREFNLNQPASSNTSPSSGQRTLIRKGLVVASVLLCLMLGSYFSLEILMTTPTNQVESTLNQVSAPATTEPESVEPIDIEVVSYSDAYFELVDAQNDEDQP